MTKAIVFLLLFWTLLSCGLEKRETKSVLEPTGEPYLVKSLDGDTTEQSMVYDYYHDKESDKWYKAELYAPYMRLIDLENKQVLKKIKISETHQTSYVYQVYFHNWDTILTYEEEIDLIHFADSSGHIYNTIDFKTLKGFQKYKTKGSYLSRMELRDGKLYFSRSIRNYEGKAQDLDLEFYFSFDLGDSSMNTFMTYPEKFYKTGCYYSGIEKELNIQEHPEGFVVSFVSPDIHLYDHDGKLLKKKKVKSRHLGDFQTNPYPENFTEKSQKSQKKFLAEAAFYYQMRYDPFRELYYRVALPENKYVRKDNSLVDFNDRDFYIMVLDTDFNVLDEMRFDGKTYFKYKISVTKEGLLLRTWNFKHERKEPDPLRPYDIKHYEIIKINYDGKV